MAVLKYFDTGTSSWQYIAASTTANFTSWKKTMSGGETSVSGTDDNAVTLSYTVGLEQVFVNGALQVRGSDYVATTGTSITGLSALSLNDVVTVVCYAPFNVANAVASTIVDAKGDLIVGTADNTVGRLAVGSNQQVLVADSSTASGLAWVSEGLTQIIPSSVSVGSGSGSVSSGGAVTFSGASTASINGCFTSTYENYRVLITTSAMSTNLELRLRLRVSGTDSTGTNYSGSGIYNYSNSATVGGLNFTGATMFTLGGSGTILNSAAPARNLFSLEFGRPFIASETIINNVSSIQDTGGFRNTMQGFLHDAATSYDGFTLYTSTGTVTGTVRVYGYRNG